MSPTAELPSLNSSLLEAILAAARAGRGVGRATAWPAALSSRGGAPGAAPALLVRGAANAAAGEVSRRDSDGDALAPVSPQPFTAQSGSGGTGPTSGPTATAAAAAAAAATPGEGGGSPGEAAAAPAGNSCQCPACCLNVADPIIHPRSGKSSPAAAPSSALATASSMAAAASLQPMDLSQTFLLHSNPSATKTIYLDFDGYEMASSIWENGGSLKVGSAFSTIDDSVRASIQNVFKSVAEDFSPFGVNVTTQDPGSARLSKSSSSDQEYGIRVVFTQNINLNAGRKILNTSTGSGGQAYYDSFNFANDEPAFVFNLASDYAMAETASHETGHALYLYHDGNLGGATATLREYYQGHGSGDLAWGTLMGAAYLGAFEPITQWSKGEYRNANQLQDDLSVITTKNGFGYRVDDHGNSAAAATVLSGTNLEVFGLIETSSDLDWFSFDTGAGAVSLSILNVSQAYVASGVGDYGSQTYSRQIQAGGRPNLKIAASLWDSSGTLVATSNSSTGTGASFDLNLAAGRYSLSIDGVGTGSPTATTPTGFTDYGSLGQYLLSGVVQEASGLVVSAPAELRTAEDGTAVTFSVALAQAPTATVTVAVSSDTPAEGVPQPSSLTFTTDNWATPQTVTVSGVDDAVEDGRQSYSIRLDASASADPWYASRPVKTLNFVNDDDDGPGLSLSGPVVPALEGVDAGVSFALTLSRASAVPVTVTVKTVDGSAKAGSDFVGGVQTIDFAVGQTSRTVSVQVIDDSVIEPDESFALEVVSVVNAQLGGASQQNGWITDTVTSSTTTTLPALVEVLKLDNGAAVNATGNSTSNLIVGNDDTNRIKGNGGLDQLEGRAAADQFDLTGLNNAANRVRILDWENGLDSLLLSDSLTSRVVNSTVSVRTISSLLSTKIVLETGSGITVGTKVTPGYDLFLVSAPIVESDVDLAQAGNGTQLLDGLSSATGSVKLTTTTRGGSGYIGAYDNDQFYLYHFNAGGDKTVLASEIQLIATLVSPSFNSSGIGQTPLPTPSFAWG
ncbi:MAG: Calx-beta domain-containing protein [Synechococcaceae cyanobacterium]|nr:Calx-beta domain-containing protein [Synechococcaceae cyanobacterium]